MNDFFKGVLASLIATGVFELLLWLGKRFSLTLIRRDPRITPILYYLSFIIWGIAGIILHYYVIFINKSFVWLMPAFLVWSFLLILHLIQRRNQIRYVGIYGVDREIRKGIDYQKSLLLIKNEFKFLGIGAGKLTHQKVAFEHAIKNCVQHKPVKFLLLEPTNEILIDAANRFGRPVDEYKNIVRGSLRTIADLKQKFKNIEVRFYQRFQIFRMMFIDDSICLLSYNVTGEGDGSQLPQIYVIKPVFENIRVTNTLYYPLEKYFKDLWEISRIWDFNEYL